MQLDILTKFHIYYLIGVVGMFTAIFFAAHYDMWWWLLAAFIYAKLIMTLGAHIGLHRYFTHGSFKTTPTKHKILTWLSFFSCEGTPIMWFIHHNHHHQHSDTELDISSPKYGFVNAF